MENEVKALRDLQDRFYSEFDTLFSQALSTIEQRHQQVLNDQERFNSLYPKLQQTQTESAVTLNIGGNKFSTSLSTLRSQKDSFFDVMFSERWTTKPLEDGSFFVDRDPYVFRHILNFMREGRLDTSNLSNQEIDALRKDAEYYHLDKLIRILNPNNNIKNNNNSPLAFDLESCSFVWYNDNYTEVRSTDSLTSKFCQRVVELKSEIKPDSKSTYRFHFKVLSSAWVALGLRDSARPKPACSSSLGHGFFVMASNGSTYSSHNDKLNGKPDMGFEFSEGEIISVVYDGTEKNLSFKSSIKNFSMKVQCAHTLIPVVILDRSAAVSIINS